MLDPDSQEKHFSEGLIYSCCHCVFNTMSYHYFSFFVTVRAGQDHRASSDVLTHELQRNQKEIQSGFSMNLPFKFCLLTKWNNTIE